MRELISTLILLYVFHSELDVWLEGANVGYYYIFSSVLISAYRILLRRIVVTTNGLWNIVTAFFIALAIIVAMGAEPSLPALGFSWWITVYGFSPYLLCSPHLNEKSTTKSNSQLLFSTFCCLLSWISAVVVPLDRDDPWQKWPICSTYGAFLGGIIGDMLSLSV